VETRSLKKCSKCGEEKSLSEFRFRKDQNRYVSICKQCACKQQKLNVKVTSINFILKIKNIEKHIKKKLFLLRANGIKKINKEFLKIEL
jgi:hypothetical protein